MTVLLQGLISKEPIPNQEVRGVAHRVSVSLDVYREAPVKAFMGSAILSPFVQVTVSKSATA